MPSCRALLSWCRGGRRTARRQKFAYLSSRLRLGGRGHHDDGGARQVAGAVNTSEQRAPNGRTGHHAEGSSRAVFDGKGRSTTRKAGYFAPRATPRCTHAPAHTRAGRPLRRGAAHDDRPCLSDRPAARGGDGAAHLHAPAGVAMIERHPHGRARLLARGDRRDRAVHRPGGEGLAAPRARAPARARRGESQQRHLLFSVCAASAPRTAACACTTLARHRVRGEVGAVLRPRADRPRLVIITSSFLPAWKAAADLASSACASWLVPIVAGGRP